MFHYMVRTQFIYPFTCRWTPVLFPVWGFCEEGRHGNFCANVFVDMLFTSAKYIPWSGIVGRRGRHVFNLS